MMVVKRTDATKRLLMPKLISLFKKFDGPEWYYPNTSTLASAYNYYNYASEKALAVACYQIHWLFLDISA